MKPALGRKSAKEEIMTTIKNLTPHDINIIAEDGTIIATFPSEGVARASQQSVKVGEINGIELVSMKFGETVDLPDPEDDVMLVVSVITINAAKAQGRVTSDLLMTADPVRNEAGQIIGCRRFAVQ